MNRPQHIDKSSIASYYDEHSRKMLKDYVFGNLRVAAAIELVLDSIKKDSGSILDIGCGIGAAAYAYSRKLMNFKVHGVDISPRSVEIAEALFGSERTSFEVNDMTSVPIGGPFDVLALIDVYEHIPRSDRSAFHKILNSCIAENGTVVLTTPSSLHQQFLQEHEPEGLQIVDETVTLEDIVQLAKDLNTTVTHFKLVTIWKTNQYLHVVLERSPQMTRIRENTNDGFGTDGSLRRTLNKASRFSRNRHVFSRLGIRVSESPPYIQKVK